MKKYDTVMLDEKILRNDNEVEIGNNIINFETEDDDRIEEKNKKTSEIIYEFLKKVRDIIDSIIGKE